MNKVLHVLRQITLESTGELVKVKKQRIASRNINSMTFCVGSGKLERLLSEEVFSYDDTLAILHWSYFFHSV